MTAEPGGGASAQGPLYIFFAVVIGVSLIAFMRATHEDAYDFSVPVEHTASSTSDHVPTARSYRDMRDSPRGSSGFDRDLAMLEAQLPSRADAVELSGAKEAALAARSQRRAYDGAPPVIPHPVRQRSASECRACHERGIALGAKTAPMYPHDAFQSCTQCHAMAEPNLPWGGRSAGLEPDPRGVDNSFVGSPAPAEGPRWTGIAPPRIPHTTFMHERCESCHGVTGANAMRSTHPDRQNCEQCHAPQAELEWRPGGRR